MTQFSTDSEPQANLDDWRPQPFAERKSQHVTFGDYFNRFIFKLLVGTASGTAIGWCIDTLRASKTNHINQGFTSFKTIGGFIGMMVGGYFSWKRNEAPMLQLDQVYSDYKNLPGLVPTNTELAQDNAILKRIAQHQRESNHPTPSQKLELGQHAHDGVINAGQQRELA